VKKHAHLYNRQARKEKKKKKRVEEALRKSEKNKTKVKLLSFGRNDPERERWATSIRPCCGRGNAENARKSPSLFETAAAGNVCSLFNYSAV
jgi:hypothetical protein